jgi:hypothetical protein
MCAWAQHSRHIAGAGVAGGGKPQASFVDVARCWMSALFQTSLARRNPMEIVMFLAVGVVLVVLWLLGFLAFHIAGGLIHILLVLAIIAVIVHFVTGRRRA